MSVEHTLCPWADEVSVKFRFCCLWPVWNHWHWDTLRITLLTVSFTFRFTFFWDWLCQILDRTLSFLCLCSSEKPLALGTRKTTTSHYLVLRRDGTRCCSRFFLSCVQVSARVIEGEGLSETGGAEDFLLTVASYLCSVWMFKLMPDSYYDVESPVVWWNVLAQFLVVDFFTYLNHRIVRFVTDIQRLTSTQSHIIAPLYKAVHKPHHKFTMPKQYNAFNGSVFDTVSLILIPLFITHQVCRYVRTESSVKVDQLTFV